MFAKVDGPQNRQLLDRFEVTHYPTLKFFLKENEIEFEGKRDINSLMAWAVGQT